MSYPLTAVISDIHGNRQALEVCLRDAEQRGVERFVCLGDVVGYGADPRACLDEVMIRCVAEPTATRQINLEETAVFDAETLSAFPPDGGAPSPDGVNGAPESDSGPDPKQGSHWLEPGLCLKGNHEEALLNSPEDFNPKARAAIEWTKEEVWRDKARADAYWDFIGDLPETAVDERAMFAHGSPRDPVREYVVPRDIKDTQKMNALFAAMSRGVCFIGHSHVPAVLYEDGSYFVPKGQETVHGPYALGDLDESRAIVNVGSVGQPRDGDPRLSYVLFDGENVTFVRLPYDHASAAESIRRVDALPEFLADRLEAGR